MTVYDAIVVGGGLVGSSTAYHLARSGDEILLLDRADEGRATTAGAGIVFPATSSRSESPAWYEFALDATDYYPDLASELEGYDHSYSRPGLLSVAVDAEETDEFEAMAARTERRTEEYGRPRSDRTGEVSPDRARELYPPLADAERAMYFEDGARVDGEAFAGALQRAARDAGLTIERNDVTGIRTADGVARGVSAADGEEYDAETVVVAGGAWSAQFESDLGSNLPIEPQRGQIFHLDVAGLDYGRTTAEWPIVTAFNHQYQVPWTDGRVACGATREANAGFSPHATLHGLREVSAEALRIAPGLADARHLETRVGLRPATPDGLPVLGRVPTVENAFVATGHGPTGLTLGPYSGKVVADLVRGAGADSDLSPFRVERFQ